MHSLAQPFLFRAGTFFRFAASFFARKIPRRCLLTWGLKCSFFGELALLYDQPRAATVRATAKCKLWVMERSVYNTIFRQEMKDVRAAKMGLIKSSPIFNVLSETLQGSLCDALQPLEKEANSVLFYKGDEGQLFYIVKVGTVEITIGDKVLFPCMLYYSRKGKQNAEPPIGQSAKDLGLSLIHI